MAGYVCTVAGGKGGVGKTTTATNLAAALAARDHEVVVVDADLGMANLAETLGVDPDPSLHAVLAAEATVDEALVEAGNLSVVPGERSLDALPDADPARLRAVVETLRTTHDVVVVDTGAGLSHETAVPLGLADGVLLVTTPDDVAVDDTEKTADLADRVDGSVLGAVVTRVTADTDLAAIEGRLGHPVLGVVPEGLPDADPPLVAEADAPAAEAYRGLAAALEAVLEGEDPVDVDPAVDEAWFTDEGGTEDDKGGDDEEGDDEGGSSGPFGLFG